MESLGEFTVLPFALVDDVADRLDDGHREDERRQSWSMMA